MRPILNILATSDSFTGPAVVIITEVADHIDNFPLWPLSY